MFKSELVQRLHAKCPHLYQRDVQRIVNIVLGEIVEAFRNGDRVELRGFGTFTAKERIARTGRNPPLTANYCPRRPVDNKAGKIFESPGLFACDKLCRKQASAYQATLRPKRPLNAWRLSPKPYS